MRPSGVRGRSPRGRRSLGLGDRLQNGDGSISAWAEEPIGASCALRRTRVDLRVGGGAAEDPRGFGIYSGRSPRGRRSPGRSDRALAGSGSISAWAEEPRASDTFADFRRVDLRVGGGAALHRRDPPHQEGRSPRGRRSPLGTVRGLFGSGSISAWAEEPRPATLDEAPDGVDLRVGGGAASIAARTPGSRGRSPRGRRSLTAPVTVGGHHGSISAWAEEPICPTAPARYGGVDLRVGGGAGRVGDVCQLSKGRSPRGRRSHRKVTEDKIAEGSISAWAEEPVGHHARPAARRVDLRVGGGARTDRAGSRALGGRSPRGRRSRYDQESGANEHGSISAWAEEPSRRICHATWKTAPSATRGIAPSSAS